MGFLISREKNIHGKFYLDRSLKIHSGSLGPPFKVLALGLRQWAALLRDRRGLCFFYCQSNHNEDRLSPCLRVIKY